MPTILITGSNRGLGLELARQYVSQGWRVHATCRHPAEADELQYLAARESNLSIHRLDITSAEDIQALGWELEDSPIDVLFNNAGIYLERDYLGPPASAIRFEDWLRTLEVNTLGAVRVTEAFLDNVAASRQRLVAVMTSHMGSIADISQPGSYYYRSSKAALTSTMRGLALALEDDGIGVLLLHPGGVRTRMGPSDGITPAEAVRGIRERIENFTLADTGAFLKYDGSRMPW